MKSIVEMKIIVLCLVLGLAISSCKENIEPEMAQVHEKKENYDSNPTKETAAGYIAAVTLYSAQNPQTSETKKLLKEARKVAEEQKQSVVSAGLLNELIKQFPSDSDANQNIAELITSMEEIGKKSASQALKFFYTQKYPNDEKSKTYLASMGEMPANSADFLQAKGESIFENVDAMGLNRNAAFEYVDATEAYVMVNPTSDDAPANLFKAAEIAKTVGTFKKALSLYDWVINTYPESEQAPMALFLKAFVLEDNMKNIEAARSAYEQFLVSYPDHSFADDAEFSLNNLGKTNEEIQAELEKLQQQNQANNNGE